MSRLSEWTAQFFNIPEEALGSARVVISGRSEVIVENARGIADYTPELVRVKMADGAIRISGSHLTIRHLNRTAAAVSGKIGRVELEEGGR